MLSDTMMLGGGRKAAYPIENSLLFRGGQYLSRRPSVAGNQKTFTVSAWFRRVDLETLGCFFTSYSGTDQFSIQLGGVNNALEVFDFQSGAYTLRCMTSPLVLRDMTAWYHVVVAVDVAQPVAGDRVRVWLNGVPLALSFLTTPDTMLNTMLNRTFPHAWGFGTNGAVNFNGYLAEPVFVDGQALSASTFGETDTATGSWRPKKLTGIDFGANGFYLGNPWNPTYLGKDHSGAAVVAAFEALAATGSNMSFSNENRTISYTAGAQDGCVPLTAALAPDGKYHVEWQASAITGTSYAGGGFGLSLQPSGTSTLTTAHMVVFGQLGNYGLRVVKNGAVAYSGTYATSDRICVELDVAAATALVKKNGITVVTLSDIIVPANPRFYGYTSNGTGEGRSGTATYNLGQSAFLDTPSAGYTGVITGNDWQAHGFAVTDVVKDTPTNVHATLNPLSKGSLVKLSEGNLKRKTDSTTANNGYGQYTYATLPIPAGGAWQMEVRIDTSAANGKGGIGVAVPASIDAHTTTFLSYYPDLGKIVDETGDLYSGVTATLGDLIQVVADTTAGMVSWYKNGMLLYSHSRDVAGWFFNVRPYASNVPEEHSVNFGQRAFAFLPEANARPLCTANLPATTGISGGSFIGNASTDGPCVYTGAVPQTLAVNGNAVTWGVHADKLATGFKLRTASTSYNGIGVTTWTATYDRKPTIGSKGRAPANAQANP